jgi:drug/metabolite transporter (DMT)-like permease
VLVGLLAALGAAVIYGVSAVLQAQGTRQVADTGRLDAGLALRLLRVPAFDLALVLAVGGFLLHLIAIRMVPLFLAQSGIAASLVVTALLAAVFFGEHLSLTDWSAVGAVCLGLVLLGVAAGDAGDEGGRPGLTAWLWAGVAVVLLVGLAAARIRTTLGVGLLSVTAGLGYTVVGVAGRALPALDPASVVTSGVVYALAAAAGLAFLLYSIALQRGAVAVATAPMIALQTAGPAVVGVALLDDRVRDGWWPVAAVGFVLALAGAVLLVRFEAVREPAAEPTP